MKRADEEKNWSNSTRVQTLEDEDEDEVPWFAQKSPIAMADHMHGTEAVRNK